MDIQPIFYSFLASEQLELSNSDDLKQECIRKVAEDPGADRNQCYIREQEASLPAFHELFYTIQEKLDELYKHFELSDNYKLQIRNAWINQNETLSTSSAHCHAESVVSGVYYVSASELSGILEFITPVTAASYTFFEGSRKNMNGFNSDRWSVTPQTGKLIMFPSWLYHYVKPNVAEDNRISIAFNANFVDLTGNLTTV
jgi:uncharacterized protein (TIGR02466 family)